MKRTPLLLFAALGVFPAARADISVEAGPVDNRASHIGGFRIILGDPGLSRKFTGEDKVLPPDQALLTSVTLTTRDTVSSPGTVDRPLYLKVYDSRERARMLGASTNALRWDPPEGAPLGTAQTYAFTGVTVPTGQPLYFVLETAPEAKSPVGTAGLSLNSERKSSEYLILLKDLTDFSIKSAPTVTVILKASPGPAIAGGTVAATPGVKETPVVGSRPVAASAEAGPPYALIGGLVGAAALVAGGIFFALGRRPAKPVAPSPSPSRPAAPRATRPPVRGAKPLPPPPGK